MITMLQHHGIIYRTGSRRPAGPARRSMEDFAKPRPDHLLGTWRIMGIKVTDSGIVQPDGSPLDQNVKENKDNTLISFFPDSSFTRVNKEGGYSAGRWAFDTASQTVFLTANRNTDEIGVFFSFAGNGLKLINLEFSPQESVSLVEYGRKLSRFQDDPYFDGNNWWRIKPEKPETDEQIRARLVNYLAHTALILKSAQIREQDYISMEFSQGIVKLYNVGIGIVKKDQIPATWAQGFYSMEDARKAYDMFEDYLFTAKHKKYESGNWVRDDHNILVDIRNGIQQK